MIKEFDNTLIHSQECGLELRIEQFSERFSWSTAPDNLPLIPTSEPIPLDISNPSKMGTIKGKLSEQTQYNWTRSTVAV